MYAKLKRTMFAGLFIAVALALTVFSANTAHAAPIIDLPVTVEQPNGEVIHIFATGDEYYHWLHDAQGYTIVQDPKTGYFVYADVANNELVPTQYIVNQVDPASVGLRPFLNISVEKMGEIRKQKVAEKKKLSADIQPATTTGSVSNLVVFIRFAGVAEFSDTKAKYDAIFNDTTPGANSTINFYHELSYNALTVNSTYYPTPPGSTMVSYQDSHTRNYYQPYNAVTNPSGYTADNEGIREQTLLRDALTYVAGLGQFPGAATLDKDNDGFVDSITFVLNGVPDGWGDLLWPHQSSMWYYDVPINGKLAGLYMLVFGGNVDNGTVSHELGHLLIGAPDLYHYNGDGKNPSLTWDLMSAGFVVPQHMTCYIKYRYAHWLTSIPEISTPGTYSLNPMTSPTGQCYKISSPNSTAEYFIVEYRSQASSIFENAVPGSGLIVYRINTAADGMGNGVGPIDELYVYRPGGTTVDDGDIYSAHLSSDVSRTTINNLTNPNAFLASGNPGGLSICNVGSASSTISFNFGNCSAISASPDNRDFGNQLAGTTGTTSQSFTVTNNGGSSLVLGTLSTEANFTLTGNTCNGATLGTGATCTFSVIFAPKSVGAKVGFVSIPSNDPNSPASVGLHGTGTAPIFSDTTSAHWAAAWVERLYASGITGGCSSTPLLYCPDSSVTRAQMAVFLLKGIHGAGFTPPAVNGVTNFADVATDYWAAAWIKQLAAEGITSGCGNGNYCPEATVTRAQMAIFLLKARHGPAYTPSNATGVFSDVTTTYWAAAWIEQLAAEGITGGCGTGIYCPDSSVTRGQMAVFLIKTFNLP